MSDAAAASVSDATVGVAVASRGDGGGSRGYVGVAAAAVANGVAHGAAPGSAPPYAAMLADVRGADARGADLRPSLSPDASQPAAQPASQQLRPAAPPHTPPPPAAAEAPPKALAAAHASSKVCEAGAGSEEGAAWARFTARHPTLLALDVKLAHLLGDDLEALSMAQVSELLDVHSGLVAQLEEARLGLARRQEREVVEERMIQTFERIHEQQRQQQQQQW